MLKSALELFLLPPVAFIYVIAAGLVLIRRRFGKLLLWAGLAGLAALAMPVVASMLTVALERDLPLTPPPDAMPRAIVILGGEVVRALDPPLTRPGPLTLERERAGAALARRTGLPIMVTGGIVRRGRPAVAQVMADSLAADFRMPAEWVEDRSATTWENALFSAAILKKQGIDSVYVVTQAWHMRRAVLAFRKAGLTVTAAPTFLDSPADPIPLDFVPRASTWLASYYAIHEWVGYVWYSGL